ncbi:MAG: Gfo/Idh/MocA family protein [Bacilli bacterium]
MQNVRALVIGGGSMGSMHAHAYKAIPHAQLAGIFDPYEKGRMVAERLQVPYYQRIDQLDVTTFDVVHVCVPTFLHRQYVEWAAGLGKHVFCEKPIALTLEDAQAMVAVCERNGVRLTVGHCVRFFPEYVSAKRAIDEGAIGSVVVARLFRGGSHPEPTTWNDWYSNRKFSGGVMMDLMIHDFDFLLWALGPVQRVYAKTLEGEHNRLDLALVTLRFASGAIGHVEGTWAHQGFGTRFEFAGDKGLLANDSFKAQTLVVQRHSPDVGEGSVQIPSSPARRSSYQIEIEDFVDALITERTFRVTPQDAVEALRVSLAAVESAATGRPVELTKSGGF